MYMHIYVYTYIYLYIDVLPAIGTVSFICCLSRFLSLFRASAAECVDFASVFIAVACNVSCHSHY